MSARGPTSRRPSWRARSLGLWHHIVGRPLRADELSHEEISAPEGLAALSLDALTSVAYGPQALMLVLVTAGVGALRFALPVTIAIVVLLALLVLSYRQVIDAYPMGGGAYAVSRENLGDGWSRLAGAALIVDYVLTVAVSVAAGVAALTSAFPALAGWTVPLGLFMVAVITWLNLRGVGESARAFLLPTFVFIVGILAVIAVGLVHPMGGAGAGAAGRAVPAGAVPAVGAFLLLKAFAAGTSALTGVEAIANGVPLFREPRAERAKQTELWLGILLGTMLLGLATLAIRFHVDPGRSETVLSQVMGAAIGRSWPYYVVAMSVTAVLGLAANTSYGGLPILLSLLARDHLAPHLFNLRGDRYVFQWGIWVLTALASLLLVVFRGNTDALVSLFAIGVFIGFTLSQAGMVVHWSKVRTHRWIARAAVNGVGAVATGIATLVFVVAKFGEGAWVVVVAIPLLLITFRAIRAYYTRLGRALAVGHIPPTPQPHEGVVVVLVNGVNRATAIALSEALSQNRRVIAVSVVFSAAEERALDEAWANWNPGVRLITLRSEYRSIVRPILRFLDSVDVRGQESVLVLIPEVVPRTVWQALLHNQMGAILQRACRNQAGYTVARLPIRLPEA